ncbi:hypothetical protein BAUCODRAFT_473441 [Baudoinia panamericana UAMH 10762]|uniref:Carboxymuconolactone decarboxylase-like domain-containing protein n=1 Tax=Baudoinia panamericana (strain UAMH 10762) TaxID=717646 RepID=M2MXV6_BAUPA|nr:uncharacterized protein BAUCODRAFT_473441 [Baudoinia panamericana UAMH 10762]EMC96403.1 hypothetical protein BAUCODRAFT_473441 [Baudoinia panamericana UAMH 10762]
MSRLSPARREELPNEQQKAYDELDDLATKGFGDAFIYKQPDGAFVGPFPFLIAAPEAGIQMLETVGKVAGIPGLPQNARETAILATGAHYKAAYELYAHSNVATKSTDLNVQQVWQICDGKKPANLDEKCEIAYDVATYLSSTPGPLPQTLWKRAVRALGKDGTIALVHYVGLYAYTCIILNAVDAPVPEGSN